MNTIFATFLFYYMKTVFAIFFLKKPWNKGNFILAGNVLKTELSAA